MDGVGLYPGGNTIPTAHLTRGLTAASKIVPRDSAGSPSASGVIGLSSIGVSNTTYEFSKGAWNDPYLGTPFKARAEADPKMAPSIVIVDGAQEGRPVTKIVNGVETSWPNPDSDAWKIMLARLAAAGVTRHQVQALWIKLPEGGPGGSTVTKYISRHLPPLIKTLKNARDLFPNLQQAYFSSRIYGGYGTGLSPEPYAYWHGLAIKEIVQRQINGLLFSRPWLAWGPYLWADGLIPRSDGLTWECGDMVDSDGIHPGGEAVDKVATMLLDSFKTHLASCAWFLLEGC